LSATNSSIPPSGPGLGVPHTRTGEMGPTSSRPRRISRLLTVGMIAFLLSGATLPSYAATAPVPQSVTISRASGAAIVPAVELSAVQARDKFRISTKAADRYVKNGSTTVISGAVRKNGHRTAGVNVRLFLKIPGGKFRATSHVVRTNSAGRWAFRVKPHSGRDYQVRGAGVSSVTVRVGVRATTKARQNTAVVARAGLAWEMVGSTSPKLAGSRVLAQRWNGKKWSDVGQSRVRSSGRYVVKVPAGTARARYYRAAVIAKKAFIGGPGYSKRIVVKTNLRPATSAGVKVAAGEYTAGDQISLTSKTTTRLAGKPVRVQRLTASQGWVNTGTGTVDSNGRIRAIAVIDTAGTKKLRITLPAATGYYAKGYTASVEVVVSPPAPDCDQDPTLCTYEVLDAPSADLVVLANAERAAANPDRIAAGQTPLQAFQSYPTDELRQAAVDCAMQNARDTSAGLRHCAFENLYGGTRSSSANPATILAAWMASAQHKFRVLDSDTVYAAGAVVKRSDGLVVAALAFN